MSDSSTAAPVEQVDDEAVGGARHARLFVTRVDPWSVMKTAFVLSLGIAIIIIVASMIIWLLLTLSGTFDSINQTISDVGGAGSSSVDVAGFVSFGRVIGMVLIVAAFEVVLTSALATVVAAIYNVTVNITGGVDVTLSEDQGGIR